MPGLERRAVGHIVWACSAHGAEPPYWRRAATYVDRILEGANPAYIPVEQMDLFELIINLKTAKARSV
jgi:ABC-type uncharacterized transport system substrate-binding protein